jgi:hypothetical protein
LIQEPHPADDLNGFDVARKLTILSRTISAFSNIPTSLPKLQSFKSVETASLIPPALEGIPTGDEFISRLPEFDSEFAKLRTEANGEGKVLRFVGVVDVVNGQIKAGLDKYVLSLTTYDETLIEFGLEDIPSHILSRLHLVEVITSCYSIPRDIVLVRWLYKVPEPEQLSLLWVFWEIFSSSFN